MACPDISDAALRHLPGLPDDMPAVETFGFAKTQHAVASAVRLGTIAAFIGDAGLGKTFAVDHAVRRSPLPVIWIQVGPKPSPKEVTQMALKELTGTFSDRPLYELSDDLIAELADDPHVVVVDEAQNLGKAGLDQVRYIHDRSRHRFPLLLVGGASCGEVLRADRQLADRVGAWVYFKPLAGPDLYRTLDTYHPFFAASDRDLLARIDDLYAAGVFRRWARVLQQGLLLAERARTPDRLTEKVAGALLAMLADGSVR